MGLRQVARILERAPSTVCRELQCDNQYCAHLVHQQRQAGRTPCRPKRKLLPGRELLRTALATAMSKWLKNSVQAKPEPGPFELDMRWYGSYVHVSPIALRRRNSITARVAGLMCLLR